jgi:hypothetical protein
MPKGENMTCCWPILYGIPSPSLVLPLRDEVPSGCGTSPSGVMGGDMESGVRGGLSSTIDSFLSAKSMTNVFFFDSGTFWS